MIDPWMGQIGRFLAALTPVQEDRVLTRTMEPIYHEPRIANGLEGLVGSHDCRCMVMTAMDSDDYHSAWGQTTMRAGFQYERLCRRFTIARVNAAIRNRVLANQARRSTFMQEVHA